MPRVTAKSAHTLKYPNEDGYNYILSPLILYNNSKPLSGFVAELILDTSTVYIMCMLVTMRYFRRTHF